jgi:galactokinase
MRTRTLEELHSSGDIKWFAPALRRLAELDAATDALPRDFFDAHAPVYVARAPGRLDVMGGIADYSGSLVLQLPLECATTAMLQPRGERTIEILSLRAGQAARFAMTLDELLSGELRDPERLAAWFDARAEDRWAAYVVGVAHACLVRGTVHARDDAGGFRMLIESRVPEGKGVSSSAALEVACLSAIAARYGVELSGEETATAAQWAENHIAGAPCGIMDQMTSACGQRDRLLRLRCQPGSIEGQLPIPAGYRFYGIDSGIRHAVTGADYGTVRTAAFMGYRIIADLAGLPTTLEAGRALVDDREWRGYLANMNAEFELQFRDRLPERMTGADFLARYGGITDVVTRVDPERTYPVRQAALHPVRENARVAYFAALLEWMRDASATTLPSAYQHAVEMGGLMYASHASYGACGLGSAGTDQLVELVREAGPERGLFGAKITGGGSGGTVAVLGTTESEPLVREIAARYASESGRVAELFTRSGPGAAELGVLVVPSLAAARGDES